MEREEIANFLRLAKGSNCVVADVGMAVGGDRAKQRRFESVRKQRGGADLVEPSVLNRVHAIACGAEETLGLFESGGR